MTVKRPQYKIFASLVTFLCFLFVSAFILEIGIRIFHPREILQMNWWMNHVDYTYDPNLIYSGVTRTSYMNRSSEYVEKVTTNSYGYRDYEFKQKKANAYRILAVGDSFTFGHGIESNDKTYPKLLENYLQNYPSLLGKKIEVFNIAAKGYSPDQEYRQIQKVISSLKPNMIIWNLSMPGDIYNLLHEGKWPSPSLYDVKNNVLVPLDARFNWLYISKYIKSHVPPIIGNSYLFNMATYRISQIRSASRKPYLSDIDMIVWATQKINLEINGIQKLTKENNIQFVVVTLPYPQQFLSQPDVSNLIHEYDVIAKSAQQAGVLVIDMKQSILQKKSQSWKELYFKTDYHPNQNGALFFAETVGEVITPFIPLN